MNEPCRLCGSEPTLANYYDFYRFHCPTPGCREHMGEWKIVNGKGEWYGSIDEAREAWNHRQKRGEAASAPQTIEPEPEPTEAENEPQDASYALGRWIGEQILKKRGESQDDSKRKTKKQLRAEAVERLKSLRYHTNEDILRGVLGWGHEPHFEDNAAENALIDLLTDDESIMQSDFVNCGNPYRKGQAVLDAAIIRPMDAGRDDDWTCTNGIGQASIDTREQLESDIRRWWDKEYPGSFYTPHDFMGLVVRWLDRQAAITKAEGDYYCDKCRIDVKRKIAELTAERDKLQGALDIAVQNESELEKRNGELLEGRAYWIDQAVSIYRRFYPHNECAVPADVCSMVLAKIDELEAERNEAYRRGYDDGLHANTRAAFSAAWQALGDESTDRFEGGIIKSQAQRIRELETECNELREKSSNQRKQLSELQDAIHKRNEGELKRQWKQQVEELQAENKRLRGEWESEKDYADQCEAWAEELAAERDYWKSQMRMCLDHITDTYIEAVMEWPNDGCTPSTLVIDNHYCLKDFYAEAATERDRLKDVVQKQADSFAKLECELHEAKVEAKHNRDGVERLTEKCQAQREELARFNAEKRGKRRLPKHVAWPRHDDGKLVKLDGLDAKNIVFTRDSCLVRYNDGTDEFFGMKELRERWKDQL